RTIRKVTRDMEALSFNTAITAMMVLVNHLSGLAAVPRAAVADLVKLVSPIAPHVAEEIWRIIGHDESIAHEPWPTYDEALCIDDVVEMAVQVNGRVRGRVMLPRAATEDEARKAALGADGVVAFTQGKPIKKFIFVPGKIINIVA